MYLLHPSSQFSTVRFLHLHPSFPVPACRRFLPVRSSLPFPNEKAKYYKELEAAVDVVQRACCLCVDIKKSLFSSDASIIEKNDSTPVTVADFGVQALGMPAWRRGMLDSFIKLNVYPELSKLFPTVPLVAEEDSGFLRSNNLVDSVLSVVTDKASSSDKLLTQDNVLEAIDRGGKNAIVYGNKPATYWVLDPIDGTRGFLKGSDAIYVVGLALVVEGEIVLGVMGCPNWQEDTSYKSTAEVQGSENLPARSGVIMVAHVGCGTWKKRLSVLWGGSAKLPDGWTRCYVDECSSVPKARFCIPESQTWASLPLSTLFGATSDDDSISQKEILVLQACCGSLCKYLMVASGRATVFIVRARSQTIIKAWDHAVGLVCVHEAGGKVTDWNGSKLDLAADQVERRIIFPSGGVLASNGSIHGQILEMISSSSSTV